MIEISIAKQDMLPLLTVVANAVDKKQAIPALANVFCELKEGYLHFSATDLEMEIKASMLCCSDVDGCFTMPAKKIIDILRSLDDDAHPKLKCTDNYISISEGRSNFKLATFPANDYPASYDEQFDFVKSVNRDSLYTLLYKTHFAMSQQDVRAYLNGLCLEFFDNKLTAVATDGHRMAIANIEFAADNDLVRVLVPKKSVFEWLRVLQQESDTSSVELALSKSCVELRVGEFILRTQLIDAKFPPYQKAIPRKHNIVAELDSELLKKTLHRIMIVAHEKTRGVSLKIETDELTIVAYNQANEEAVETVSAKITGESISIGVNASYLLDVINHVDSPILRLSCLDPESSILVEAVNDDGYQYIIMPMKI